MSTLKFLVVFIGVYVVACGIEFGIGQMVAAAPVARSVTALHDANRQLDGSQ